MANSQTKTNMFLNIVFVIALTFPVSVAATAFGIGEKREKKEWGRSLMFALILALGQGVMYTLGGLLGGAFMHTMAESSKWIVFALCFAIAFRMLIDTLKIKNGTNLYLIEKKKHLLLLSIALGVNAFITGLMADFLPLFQNMTPYIIMAVAFAWAFVSIIIPFTKMKLTVNSLLNVIFAAIIVVIGMLKLV